MALGYTCCADRGSAPGSGTAPGTLSGQVGDGAITRDDPAFAQHPADEVRGKRRERIVTVKASST
jgi:hypothetical protein